MIIKTMKFSHMAPVCGGPVEIAVVTTDRKFRWVRHKQSDAAIGEGGLFDVYRD
jgi:F420-0:gamma-glutamyl ligase